VKAHQDEKKSYEDLDKWGRMNCDADKMAEKFRKLMDDGDVKSLKEGLASLETHYFSWLYQYKIEHPNNTLVTEYDQCDDPGGDNANNQQEKEIDLFCGALVLSNCEILVPMNTTAINTANKENEQQEAGRNDNFKILILSGKTADPAAHNAARDHAQEISNGIKAKIDCDLQGNGDDGYYTVPTSRSESKSPRVAQQHSQAPIARLLDGQRKERSLCVKFSMKSSKTSSLVFARNGRTCTSICARQPSKIKPRQWMMMTKLRRHLKWTQTCCTWKFNVAFNTCW
jgi:hypothetical protein